jgi:hypothetical protein
MKKGIYMFEFDNSYSWINGKSVKYEMVVYTPLEIKSSNFDEWVEDFYENIYQNCMHNEEDIYVVEKKLPLKKQELPENGHIANIARSLNTLSLVVRRGNQRYEYETDDPERMEQKVAAIVKAKE